MAGKW
ncbi:hypothetical protein VCHC06A1_2038, partial [Vibrio cholerae HC-06A1]